MSELQRPFKGRPGLPWIAPPRRTYIRMAGAGDGLHVELSHCRLILVTDKPGGSVDVKVWARKVSVLAGLLVGLTSSIGTADPLHQFGTEGSWRHEYSGWQFARQVGDFSRVMAPYTIDGNNDVGVKYANGSGLTAIVEVYTADSVAPDAKLDGAKASAAQKAGEPAHVESEKPFRIKEHKGLRGTRITYAADEKSQGMQTRLYFFEAKRWTVKVLGTASGDDADKVLDAFVRALPWDTLGDPTALH